MIWSTNQQDAFALVGLRYVYLRFPLVVIPFGLHDVSLHFLSAQANEPCYHYGSLRLTAADYTEDI